METKLWRITLDTNPEDCNLKCTMCEEHSPHSDYIQTQLGGKHRRMPREWLEPLFEQAKRLGASEIIPSTMGEPLIYKHFAHFVELCYRYGLKMNLTTNGTFPRTSEKTPTEWARLIVPVSSDIKISWNGASAATSGKVMLGLDFEQTLQNVRELVAVRNAHAAASGYYCNISLQLTFMQHNMHELHEIVQLAASLDIDRVKGHHLWAHFPEIAHLSFRHDAKSIAVWNGYVVQAQAAADRYRKPDGSRLRLENIIPLQQQETAEVPYEYECPFLTRELWVSASGAIAPCCAPDEQRKGLGDFGNIKDTTLAQALASDAYQNLLANYKTIPLCRTCTMRKPVI